MYHQRSAVSLPVADLAALASPLAGVYIDRWDRHRALVCTQILSLVQCALLAILTLSGWVTVWHVLVLQLKHFGIPHSVLMPVMAAKYPGGGSYTLGALNAPLTIALGGLAYSLAGVWFWTPSLRAAVRPIYIARGILTQ